MEIFIVSSALMLYMIMHRSVLVGTGMMNEEATARHKTNGIIFILKFLEKFSKIALRGSNPNFQLKYQIPVFSIAFSQYSRCSKLATGTYFNI